MNEAMSADIDHVLRYTRPLWTELNGARLFVTGGSGFIGSWLVESFRRARAERLLDAEMVVLTRTPGRTSANGVSFVTGDVRTFRRPEGSFTHAIHAAAPATSSRLETDATMRETIVEGTRRILDF